MGMKQRLVQRVVRQFHDPSGPGGHVAGWVMGRCPSNVARNRGAVALLDVAPTDRVIEFGCGPGVALAALASHAARGLVVGVDQSAVMIRQARRRNAAAIAAGRVRLVHAPVERLHLPGGPFDAALAVNTVGFWPEPTAHFAESAGCCAPAAGSLWCRNPAARVRPPRRRPQPPTIWPPRSRKQASTSSASRRSTSTRLPRASSPRGRLKTDARPSAQ